jgi:hypothetical protein
MLELDAVPVVVPDADAVPVGVRDGVYVGVPDPVVVCESVPDPVCVGVAPVESDDVGDAVREGVPAGEPERVPEKEPVFDGVDEGDRVCVTDMVGVAEGDAPVEIELVDDAVFVGETVGVPVMHTVLRVAMHGEPVVGHTAHVVHELAPPRLNVAPSTPSKNSALFAPPAV